MGTCDGDGGDVVRGRVSARVATFEACTSRSLRRGSTMSSHKSDGFEIPETINKVGSLTLKIDALQDAFSSKLDSVDVGMGVIMESLTGVVDAVGTRLDQIQDELSNLKHDFSCSGGLVVARKPTLEAKPDGG